jgi:excisionase family DNA binding protein
MTREPWGSEQTTGAQAMTMTVPELAERIGVDVSTAYRYLKAGTLPGVQAGASWLIDRERVERFLAGIEDANGVRLVQAPVVDEGPRLTLLPEREVEPAGLALSWLRGAHAALSLLLAAADGASLSGGEDEERRFSGR